MPLTAAQQAWLQANPGRESFVEQNPTFDYGGMNQAAAERIGGWGNFLRGSAPAAPGYQTLQNNQQLGNLSEQGAFGMTPRYDWSAAALQPYQTPGATTATPQAVAPYRPTPQAAMDPATAAANNALAARVGGPAFGAGAPVGLPGGAASSQQYLNQNRNANNGTPPPLPQTPIGGGNDQWSGITDTTYNPDGTVRSGDGPGQRNSGGSQSRQMPGPMQQFLQMLMQPGRFGGLGLGGYRPPMQQRYGYGPQQPFAQGNRVLDRINTRYPTNQQTVGSREALGTDMGYRNFLNNYQPQPRQGGVSYAGGSPYFDESTGQYTGGPGMQEVSPGRFVSTRPRQSAEEFSRANDDSFRRNMAARYPGRGFENFGLPQGNYAGGTQGWTGQPIRF